MDVIDNNEMKDYDYTQYYEINEEIGKGQFGKVFKGINKKSKEMRAIKIIDIKKTEIKNINNELNNMKICSKDNDNSVKYYEHFHYKDQFVIVMELCDKSLQKILDERKEGFTSEQIFNIMIQLNNTFKIMNKNKIIHRDIKLDNILVKYKDNNNNNDDSNINFIVKLTDYGISKQLKNTINTTLMGTYGTMAPEILEEKNDYDNKCDLWSIGIIIYQLFFKEYPYTGGPVAIYNQIKTYGKNRLKKTKDENLDNLIASLLIKEPEKRINYEEYFNHPFFNNYIESEIEIDDNKEIRIINSYEEWYKNNSGEKFKEEFCNEKEIKDNCEFIINNDMIPFSYFYKFKKKGKYKIKYSFKNNLTKTNHMFSDCESLTYINLSNFNTQNVTNMSDMFSHCKSLTNINFSNFNTKNVTNMNSMFFNCKSLTNINLSNFNTQNVTNMSGMFLNCESLININLSNFNTQNVTDMSDMFFRCISLTKINLSNFNTQNVTDMSHMFWNCKSLTNIKLSNFKTQNVIDMNSMFFNCKSLTNINLSNLNTKNIINMSSMFSHCKSFSNINLSNFNTQNVTNLSDMFSHCKSLKYINLSKFNTQNVTNMSGMFSDCKSLTYINLSNFNTKNDTDMNNIFYNCKSLKKKDIITKDDNILKEY